MYRGGCRAEVLPSFSPVPDLCGILPVGSSHRAYHGVLVVLHTMEPMAML